MCVTVQYMSVVWLLLLQKHGCSGWVPRACQILLFHMECARVLRNVPESVGMHGVAGLPARPTCGGGLVSSMPGMLCVATRRPELSGRNGLNFKAYSNSIDLDYLRSFPGNAVFDSNP